MKSAEKTYLDAFEDELQGFIQRVEGRAKARLEEAIREAEEVRKLIVFHVVAPFLVKH